MSWQSFALGHVGWSLLGISNFCGLSESVLAAEWPRITFPNWHVWPLTTSQASLLGSSPHSLSSSRRLAWARGSPGVTSSKEPACQCRRHKRRRFDSWVGRIPWRRAWQPIPVFLPGEFRGLWSLVSYSPWVAKRQTRLKWLSMHSAWARSHSGLRVPTATSSQVPMCKCLSSGKMLL